MIRLTLTDCAPTYSFFSLNVARLLKNNSVNKSKINFLNDLSDESTLFVALCETFLNANIFDAEIQMQGYIICRTDRLSRPGGGVCFYIKDHIQFSTCLSFSNDMCEVLIVKLSNPQFVLINTYRPGLGSSTVDQVLKYTKYPKYIPSTSTGQVLIFLKRT